MVFFLGTTPPGLPEPLSTQLARANDAEASIGPRIISLSPLRPQLVLGRKTGPYTRLLCLPSGQAGLSLVCMHVCIVGFWLLGWLAFGWVFQARPLERALQLPPRRAVITRPSQGARTCMHTAARAPSPTIERQAPVLIHSPSPHKQHHNRHGGPRPREPSPEAGAAGLPPPRRRALPRQLVSVGLCLFVWVSVWTQAFNQGWEAAAAGGRDLALGGLTSGGGGGCGLGQCRTNHRTVDRSMAR